MCKNQQCYHVSERLTLSCPLCGSQEVFYSCDPKCCFNHVCQGCGATFEPVTRRRGDARRTIQAPDPLPDATDPAVACAACESIAVYVDADGALVCQDCGVVLELEITAITPS